MLCPPCRNDLHEFCRDCDCECCVIDEDNDDRVSDEDAWQIGQDRYEADLFGTPEAT